jgi:hypothetical protein
MQHIAVELQAFEVPNQGNFHIAILPSTWWGGTTNVLPIQFLLLSYVQFRRGEFARIPVGYGEFFPEKEEISWLWRNFCESQFNAVHIMAELTRSMQVKPDPIPPGVTLDRTEELMYRGSYYSAIYTDNTSTKTPVVLVRNDFQNSIHKVLEEKRVF